MVCCVPFFLILLVTDFLSAINSSTVLLYICISIV